MNIKRIRYITSIFTLDKIYESVNITVWDKKDISDFIEEQEKHYGLKLINTNEELLVEIEYTNIIWKYRIYYGAYKKSFKQLTENDERWFQIKEKILADLKTFGMEELQDSILINLKKKNYFKYKENIDKQFKKYCI